ncbi:hypothetical protein [Pseudogulbenkiania ferrooxidans]|nr:hypothetical protein [Pseudogulbenkiania ferrooxidans]
MSRSQSIVDYLKKLPQFMPAGPVECLDTRTGARVFAPVDAERAAQGFLAVEFPGGKMFEVIGDLYFQVQIVDAVNIWLALGEMNGSLEGLVQNQMEHYRLKVG